MAPVQPALGLAGAYSSHRRSRQAQRSRSYARRALPSCPPPSYLLFTLFSYVRRSLRPVLPPRFANCSDLVWCAAIPAGLATVGLKALLVTSQPLSMKLSKRAAGVLMASIRRKKDMGQPKTRVRQRTLSLSCSVLLQLFPKMKRRE